MQKASTEMEDFAPKSLKIYFVKISKPRFWKEWVSNTQKYKHWLREN